MKKFVFWTGIYNIVMAGTFACPWVEKMMGVPLPDSYFWLWFTTALVIYMGAVLVISSKHMKGQNTEFSENSLRAEKLPVAFSGYMFSGLHALIKRPAS